MKFETFESLINTAVYLYKSSSERDRKLTEALGGDTSVVTDDYGKVIDMITATLAKELNDVEVSTNGENWIDYLVYENLISHNYDPKELRITVNDKKYPVTIKVIWDILQKKI